MLAIIDASGGSAAVQANATLLSLNHMRAIRAVATAPAGSTPSANVIIQYWANSQAMFTAYVIPGTNSAAIGFTGTAGGGFFVSNTVPWVITIGRGGTNSTVGPLTSVNNTVLTSQSALTSVTTAVVFGSQGSLTPGNMTTANTTGGINFTVATNTIANGMLLYASNNTATPTGIPSFSNTVYLVTNTSSDNTSFQISYPNGAVVTTSSPGTTFSGILMNYGGASGSAATPPLYSTLTNNMLSPYPYIVALPLGPSGGTFLANWPGPYGNPLGTINNSSWITYNTNKTLSDTSPTSYGYGTLIFGNGTATGLAIANTTGLLTTGSTPHNLIVGQYCGLINSAACGILYIGLTNAGGIRVTQVVNATAFVYDTGGQALTVQNCPAGTILVPFPGPVSLAGFGTNNMITVISNTEGGGWLSDYGDTFLDSLGYVNTAIVNTSFTSTGPMLDLYNNSVSDKTTYPVHKISIIPSPTLSPYAASTANCILVYHGASTTRGMFTSSALATNNFAGGATVGTTIPTGPSAMVNQRAVYSGITTPFNWQLNDWVYTIGCNSQYMHIISNNFIVSMGLRNTQAWENAFLDNPPVYNFSVDTRSLALSVLYPSSVFHWSRAISNSANFITPARFITTRTSNVAATSLNPVTGQAMTGTLATVASNFYDITVAKSNFPPLFQLASHANTSFPVGYAPFFDSTTNTFVPPSYPIPIRVEASSTGQYNYGGLVKGLYKSLSSGNNGTTSMNMSLFYVQNGAYNIDGDIYTPVVNGPNTATSIGTDLFLIRRA